MQVEVSITLCPEQSEHDVCRVHEVVPEFECRRLGSAHCLELPKCLCHPRRIQVVDHLSGRVLVLGPEGLLQVCDIVVSVMGQGFEHQLDPPYSPVQLLALKHLTSSGISIHICCCQKLQEVTIPK